MLAGATDGTRVAVDEVAGQLRGHALQPGQPQRQGGALRLGGDPGADRELVAQAGDQRVPVVLLVAEGDRTGQRGDGAPGAGQGRCEALGRGVLLLGGLHGGTHLQLTAQRHGQRVLQPGRRRRVAGGLALLGADGVGARAELVEGALPLLDQVEQVVHRTGVGEVGSGPAVRGERDLATAGSDGLLGLGEVVLRLLQCGQVAAHGNGPLGGGHLAGGLVVGVAVLGQGLQDAPGRRRGALALDQGAGVLQHRRGVLVRALGQLGGSERLTGVVGDPAAHQLDRGREVGARQLAPERPAPRCAVTGAGAGCGVRGLLARTALLARLPTEGRGRGETGQHVLHPHERDGELGSGVGHGGHRRPAAVGQPLLDVGEALGVEEPLEHLAALLGAGPQERREVALGQQHDLGELLQPHADDVVDHQRRLVVAGGARHPLAAHALLEHHLGLDAWWCRCRAAWGARTRGSG